MRKIVTPKFFPKAGAAVFVASALAFFSELFGEITGVYFYNYNWVAHEIIELITLIGFLVGGALIWLSQKQLKVRNSEIEQLLKAAQGEFFAMVHAQFDRWGLSNAERDIALLTVKGLSVAEIAELRQTSQGTVKSQNNAIYRKAGVKTRTQLVGYLIDELLVEDTTPPIVTTKGADRQ